MTTDRYPIPAATPEAPHRVEDEIKRSRFLTSVGHAPTVDDARAFVDAVSAEFADASHNCWAYVAGPPGDTARIGLSDAGEPHGTAGRPMLTVLLHSGIGEIVAVVTRYFGGTLLGKGGLVQAYSGGVQLALATLLTVERVPTAELTLVVPYSAVTPLQRALPEFEAEAVDEAYAVDVTYRIKLPLEQVEPLRAYVIELTSGAALIEVGEQAA